MFFSTFSVAVEVVDCVLFDCATRGGGARRGARGGRSLRKGFLFRMNWASLVPIVMEGLMARSFGASVGFGGGFFRAAVAASMFAVRSSMNLSRSATEVCTPGASPRGKALVAGIVAEPGRPNPVGCILSGWIGPVSEYGTNLGPESPPC